MARLSFLGATRTVTGSRFLVEHNDFRLLVDSPGSPRKTVHLVHGEPSTIDDLASTLRDERGLDVDVPEYMEKVEV